MDGIEPLGDREMVLRVVEALKDLEEGEHSLEDVVGEMRGGQGSKQRVARALAAAVHSGYASRSHLNTFSLNPTIGAFVGLQKTVFRGKKKLARGRTRKAKGGKGGRCEGCDRVRACKCAVGCGCRVSCGFCKQDTVNRARTQAARQRRLLRRQQKQVEENAIMNEGADKRSSKPTSRQINRSATSPDHTAMAPFCHCDI